MDAQCNQVRINCEKHIYASKRKEFDNLGSMKASRFMLYNVGARGKLGFYPGFSIKTGNTQEVKGYAHLKGRAMPKM